MHASLQSCDGSEYTLQGPAGGDDITGLSAEPAHYQLLSELGEIDARLCRGDRFHTLILPRYGEISLRVTSLASQGGASTT